MKKIYTAVLIVWTLSGISLITTIAFTDKLGLSKTTITNIVLSYVFVSCVLAGVIYRLKRK